MSNCCKVNFSMGLVTIKLYDFFKSTYVVKNTTFSSNLRFFKSRPHMEEFLQQLLHFQHFRQFINSKIDKLKSKNIERDLFDNEVLLYEEGKDPYAS